MKKYFAVLVLPLMLAGCQNKNSVVITGEFTGEREGTVYLSLSEVDRVTVTDSATIKRGRVRFVTEITDPEFYQLGIGENDFVTLLAFPGDRINLSFGSGPLLTACKVSGSEESEKVVDLDVNLYNTRKSLDSLKKVYSGLSEAQLAVQGPDLEKQYLDIVNSQRKHNIAFILENASSMASVKAVYQRIDENTYVLYQPRDLQFLKIVSDSLTAKYSTSKHVRALTENLNRELNQMYIDRLMTVAGEAPASKADPDLLDTSGKRVRLSSLKGKYVLLSFWSVASEQCIEELALLKSLYKTYSRQGFEIYHVNLDIDEARWRNMVQFEELPWISVREDDPADPYFAGMFNITQLPSNLLYDREGNVINTNLFGRNLQIRLDQIFNK